MTRLVLLPGMDGTGDLFREFASAVGGDTQVVRYPKDRPLNYAELEALVTSELPPATPYVLLGESFSGPIAISIASTKPPLLRGLILCCSFSRNPRPGLGPLGGLVNWLPDRPPIGLLMLLLAGDFATPALRDTLQRALDGVSPPTLRSRMTSVIRVDVASKLHAISVPLLYLQGSKDRVVPRSAARTILQSVPGTRLVEIAAPHFLLQTRPHEAAAAVKKFMEVTEHAI